MFTNISFSTTGGTATLQSSGSNNVILEAGATGIVKVQTSGGDVRINGVATPTADNDATPKTYVDSVAQGLDVKEACIAATTSDLLSTLTAATTSTPAILTYTSDGPLVVDSLTTWVDIDNDGATPSTASRIIVRAQQSDVYNGIFVVKDKGSGATPWKIQRAPDMDETAEVSGGQFTFVTQGSDSADTGWVMTADNPTLDVDPITWALFSGVGSVTGSNGISVVANDVRIENYSNWGSFSVTAGTNMDAPTNQNSTAVRHADLRIVNLDFDFVVTDSVGEVATVTFTLDVASDAGSQVATPVVYTDKSDNSQLVGLLTLPASSSTCTITGTFEDETANASGYSLECQLAYFAV